MIAPRTEIFAIGAIEVALHRHVIDRDVRVEREIAARNLEQVSEIREHVSGLYPRMLMIRVATLIQSL